MFPFVTPWVWYAFRINGTATYLMHPNCIKRAIAYRSAVVLSTEQQP